MTRQKSSTPKNLRIEVGIKVRQRLDKLQRVTNANSLVEVIRRALAVYDFLWTEKVGRGGVALIRYPDGKEEALVLR